MKKYLTTLFAVIIYLTSFSQDFIEIDTTVLSCIYIYEFQEDSASKYSKRDEEMVLQIGNYYSRFTSKNKLIRDSLSQSRKNEPLMDFFKKNVGLIQNTYIHPYCKFSIYKNYPVKGEILQISYINKQYYSVKNNSALNWKIENDSDTTIIDYQCKKATTFFAGRKYTAWFTLEIPISEGPYKFQGLPGLIVFVYDAKNQHSFYLTQINKSKFDFPVILFKQENYLEVSPRDYTKALEVKISQLANRLQNGNGITVNDETKARSLDRLKSRNNFIEKY